VGDVGDERNEFEFVEGLCDLAADLKEHIFGTLDQQHFLRMIVADLPDKFRADRAAGTRHHHDASRKQVAKILVVKLDRFAAQKIFDLDIAKPRYVDASMRDLIKARHDLRLDRNGRTNVHDPPNVLAVRMIDRKNDLLDVEFVYEFWQTVRTADNFDAIDAAADLSRVVIDESAYVEFRIRAALQLLNKGCAHSPGTDDE